VWRGRLAVLVRARRGERVSSKRAQKKEVRRIVYTLQHTRNCIHISICAVSCFSLPYSALVREYLQHQVSNGVKDHLNLMLTRAGARHGLSR